MRKEGRQAHIVCADLSDLEAAEHAVARAIVALGGELDVLVSNAAASAYGPFREMPLERYVALLEQVFLVSTLAPWYTNALKRIAKTPKLHFLDSKISCFRIIRNCIQHITVS